MENQFKYSFDNKRYHTFNYYGKTHFGRKIYKVPLDLSFNCPNRDGTLSKSGCLYCYKGADGFPELNDSDIIQQYFTRKQIFAHKWPDGIPYAYFQSYSNTYADLSVLKQIYDPFIQLEDCKGLVISTRSDCLDDEKIQYFASLACYKPVWIELGLQSIHDQTLKEMNRGHDYASFKQMVLKLAQTDLKISVHLINGWPSETKEMMLESAKEIGRLPIDAVKFHMLHVCRFTPLGDLYLQKPFPLLTKEEYVDIVSEQLAYLSEEIIIERLTGDGLKEVLIAPLWTLKKVSVINDIDKQMVQKNLYQGCYYQAE